MHVYGDLHWFPRDDKLQTPPGPEGSNGSSGFGRRGVADVGRLHSLSASSLKISFKLKLLQLLSTGNLNKLPVVVIIIKVHEKVGGVIFISSLQPF